MCRSQFPPEHWMLQVTGRQRASLLGSLEDICVSIEMVVAGKPWRRILQATELTQIINPLWIVTAAGYRSS